MRVRGGAELRAHSALLVARAPRISVQPGGALRWDCSEQTGRAFLHFLYTGALPPEDGVTQGTSATRAKAAMWNAGAALYRFGGLHDYGHFSVC